MFNLDFVRPAVTAMLSDLLVCGTFYLSQPFPESRIEVTASTPIYDLVEVDADNCILDLYQFDRFQHQISVPRYALVTAYNKSFIQLIENHSPRRQSRPSAPPLYLKSFI